MKFDPNVFKDLSKVVECQQVDGVVIDEQELASLAEMIKEASQEDLINLNQRQ